MFDTLGETEDHLQVPACPKKSLPAWRRLGCVCFFGLDISQGLKLSYECALFEVELITVVWLLALLGFFFFWMIMEAL